MLILQNIMRASILAFLLLLIEVATFDDIPHVCIHGEFEYDPEILNLPYNDDSIEEGRSLQPFQNLRMHFDYTKINETSAEFKKYLTEVISPPVKNYWEEVLKLRPMSGNLISNGLTKMCNGNINVPDVYLNQGIPADLVMFVDLENKPADIFVAYTTPCALNNFNKRPLFGRIAFNTAKMGPITNNMRIERDIITTLHETTHMLGFAKFHYTNFIDPTTNKKLEGHLLKYFNCSTLEGAYLENEGQTVVIDLFSDNCPVFTIFSNLNCEDEDNSLGFLLPDKELYGSGSKCFQGTLAPLGMISKESNFYCFRPMCELISNGDYKLNVMVGNEVVGCESSETVSVPGLAGRLFCPNYVSEFCEKLAFCKRGCTGKGKCLDGTCECDDGWGGPDCSKMIYKDNCQRCEAGDSFHTSCFGDSCECNPSSTLCEPITSNQNDTENTSNENTTDPTPPQIPDEEHKIEENSTVPSQPDTENPQKNNTEIPNEENRGGENNTILSQPDTERNTTGPIPPQIPDEGNGNGENSTILYQPDTENPEKNNTQIPNEENRSGENSTIPDTEDTEKNSTDPNSPQIPDEKNKNRENSTSPSQPDTENPEKNNMEIPNEENRSGENSTIPDTEDTEKNNTEIPTENNNTNFTPAQIPDEEYSNVENNTIPPQSDDQKITNNDGARRLKNEKYAHGGASMENLHLLGSGSHQSDRMKNGDQFYEIASILGIAVAIVIYLIFEYRRNPRLSKRISDSLSMTTPEEIYPMSEISIVQVS